ncbi:MAG: tetratricopeptide repeat protein [Candidatus Competibacter sp.]|nr:tetratricopeptide repeat protein [Candidatus Competibacter sp.]MDG4584066.1 tetratricopeptide repeat protein [Candidatus Competibacter sp.]
MIETLMMQADRLADEGQFEQAKELYIRICHFAPHRAHCWYRLAELQSRLGRFEDCQQALELSLRLKPNDTAALLLALANLLEIGSYAQAVQLADRLLTAHAGNRLVVLANKSTALLRLGRFAEALAVADAALELDRCQATIHANRGSALFGLERHEEALSAFERALQLRPEYGIALINKSAVLRALRRPAEALTAVDAALATHPTSPAALLNRAAALMDLEQFEEALTTLDRLLAQQPGHAKALLNRGLALLWMERYQDVLTAIHALRALGQPADEVLLAAGESLFRRGRLDQALAWIEQGVHWSPDHIGLLRARVAILLARECYRDALSAAERLLVLTGPDQISARLAVAAALNATGQFEKSLSLLEAMPPVAKDEWQFHAKHGEALAGLDRFAEARVAFAAADRLAEQPFRANYYDGLFQVRPADSPAPPVTPELVRVSYEFRRLEHGDWRDYECRVATIRRLTEECLERSELSPLLPFRSLFLPLSQELRLAIARRESERLVEIAAVSGMARKSSQSIDREAGRIKIGYLSADFHEHPTAHLMRGFFHCHDRRRFEIYGYALRGETDNAYYQRIKGDCDHFVDLSNRDNAAAIQQIQADGIHVLIDLMVFTNYSRPEIFSHRPAPIQVNWLGFPGSSGADYLDYVLVDPVVLPPEQAVFCTEQPVYLPECYQINDRWQEVAETDIQRVDQSLPEQGFVFCCFNQIQKLEPVMFAVWMRILRRVPDSILWLYSESEEAQDNLRRSASACGVADERLVFAKRLSKDRHLERHRLADLFLDTRIYGAHTTASDALWAGLPVLTCLGEAFPARVAASLLRSVGMPELITHSLEEYEEQAVGLATRPADLALLREKLAYNRLRRPLFDTERFTRHLECAYELMWERHARGLPPAPLHVPALPTVNSR